MSEYYDKKGHVISISIFEELILKDNYRRIAKTKLDNGITISTVWLGIEMGAGLNGPLIFETMVFGPKNEEIEVYRYATEEEALIHHKHLVWTNYNEHEPIDRWTGIINTIIREEDDAANS